MPQPPRNRAVVATACWIVLCAIAGAAATAWISAPRGPGIDSDSTEYLSAADSFAHGAGWLGVDGTPFTLWPPLFSTVVGALGAVGLALEDAVRWLHVLCAAATIAGSALLVLRVSGSRIAAAACAAALCLSPALYTNTATAWSEPLFLALLVAAAHAWVTYERGPTNVRFAWLCAASAAAVLERYFGVVWIACIAFELLVRASSEPFARRVRRAATYSLASIAPVALWIARNAWVTGGADGKRGPPLGHLAHDAAGASAILSNWLTGFVASPARLLALLVPLALLAGALVAIDRRARQPARFVALYLVAVVALRQVIEFDELDERLLAPVLPFVWVAIAIAAATWCARIPRIAPAVVALWFAACMFGSARELVGRTRVWRDEGIALYEMDRWQASPTVAWLRAQPRTERWFTNDPFAYFWLLRERATPLPVRPQGFTKLHDRLPSELDHFAVVWFTYNERAVFPQAALGAHFDVERTQAFADGEIYAVRRK